MLTRNLYYKRWILRDRILFCNPERPLLWRNRCANIPKHGGRCQASIRTIENRRSGMHFVQSLCSYRIPLLLCLCLRGTLIEYGRRARKCKVTAYHRDQNQRYYGTGEPENLPFHRRKYQHLQVMMGPCEDLNDLERESETERAEKLSSESTIKCIRQVCVEYLYRDVLSERNVRW